ncbi:hypothetical protein ACJRO7_025880 [Eucalyptus globulus]|uniref:Uncharacterized protein n=1 Tax=Eucalyptus globulus TaxID=34317 RepID=A0ABD3KAI4_EUCGL
MFFYLTMLNLTKYLSEVCPIISPNEQDVTTLGALEAWKHGDFLCRNYILNCLVNSLYNVYCNIESAKQLWESLEKKYKTEDAGTKKFVVAKFLDYKMVDSKSVMSQVQELQLILSDISAKGMILSESFQVAAMIEKLPPGWLDFKNYLNHKQKEMSLEDLILRLRIKEDNRRSANPSSESKANVVESSKSKQDRKRKMSFQGKGKQKEQF